MMNVGDEKGALLDAALRERVAAACGAARAGCDFQALELGTYVGYSAVRMARFLPQRAGLGDRVVMVQRTAADSTALLEARGLRLDFVLIDHSKQDYLPALLRLERAGLLQPGCVVFADNVGVFRQEAYLRHVRGCGLYSSSYVSASVEYAPLLDYVPLGADGEPQSR